MSNNISLKGARAAAKLSQPDVARKMEVSVQTVFKWEQGIAPVARNRWSKLAVLLHLNMNELESALVQTLLEACIAEGSTRALDNAKTSRLYDPALLADAYTRFEGRNKIVYPSIQQKEDAEDARFERRKLEYEKIIVGLKLELANMKDSFADLKIKYAELEQENTRLKMELERVRPAGMPSTSSELNRKHTEKQKEVKL